MTRRLQRSAWVIVVSSMLTACSGESESPNGGGDATNGEAANSSAGASEGGAGGAADPGGAGGTAQGGEGGVYVFPDVPDYLNIVPPGQDGVVNGVEFAQITLDGTHPPHVLDQLEMYHGLVYATPGLPEDELTNHFKDATLGIGDSPIEAEYTPTQGVVVRRDASFGVPHVVGETRYATMFAQGYTGAEDRLFLMDALRHVGRARLSEFLGASEENQAMDREQLAIAPYKEADLTAQVQALGADAEGQAILADLQAYTDGVNAYILQTLVDVTKLPADYVAVQQVPLPWKLEDAVAIASLIGGALGKGGGGELANHCGLQQMTQTLGSAQAAREVFDDLHFSNDAEAPTTSPTPAPYMSPPAVTNAAAHPDIDCSTLVAVEGGLLDPILDPILGPLGGLGGLLGNSMSNAILVGKEHTKAGHPIAVFGPQTGYFAPELLVEKDVEGPGIHARGVGFAGIDMWVLLGHGDGYAWSATSSGADNIDQWVLELCNPSGIGAVTPSSMGYLRNGQCVPIETYQHTQLAKPSPGGVGLEILLSWRVERTPHYGSIVARGRLRNGKPIAVTYNRTTYGRELESARGFYRLNDPEGMASGWSAFQEAISAIEFSFNWFYLDDEHIGYQHGCRCPERNESVDPYLPAWGNGSFDWNGFLRPEDQPSTLDPEREYIVSWNNKQAPGFRANDANFSFGPTYRSEMLEKRVEAAMGEGRVDRAQIVDAMEDGATVDLRGQEVLGHVLAVMGETAPASADPRAQEMRERIAAWIEDGAHRRDHDGDGAYDDAITPAIVDAWWPRLSRAVLDTSSGNAIDALHLTIDDHERTSHTGSAFQSGLYSHVEKDMRQILGQPVATAWSRTYCGNGQISACRSALWASLSQAATDLETEFATADPELWIRDMSYENVQYRALGVITVPPQPWINRPTFQQVVQING